MHPYYYFQRSYRVTLDDPSSQRYSIIPNRITLSEHRGTFHRDCLPRLCDSSRIFTHFLTGFDRSPTNLKMPRPSARFRYFASATLVPLLWMYRSLGQIRDTCSVSLLEAIQFKILLPRPRDRNIPYLSSACAIPFKPAIVCTVPSYPPGPMSRDADCVSSGSAVMAEQYSTSHSATVDCQR